MKLLICGKGGSGKSTLSVLIAKNLKDRGYHVLLVDADESNFGLPRLMGISSPVILTDTLGGKRGSKDKMVKAFSGNSPILSNEKWKIKDIPENFLTQANGIDLMVIGKIHNFGEGCACAMGFLSKTFLSNLEVGEDEFVIVDTEAGVEHFGRRVEEGCDGILAVVDPSFESFLMAQKIQEMGLKAQTEVFLILNKVDEQVESLMSKYIDADRVIARIPKDNEIFMDSLKGKEITTQLEEINQTCDFIVGLK